MSDNHTSKWFSSIPLAKALDEICAHSSVMTFSDEKAQFDRVESELVAEGKTFLREARRRVAERILSAAISRNLPTRECSSYLQRIEKLGFTDLVQEGLIRISFCRYLIAAGEVGRAAAMLKKLRKRCASGRVESADDLQPIADMIDTMLSDIKKRR